MASTTSDVLHTLADQKVKDEHSNNNTETVEDSTNLTATAFGNHENNLERKMEGNVRSTGEEFHLLQKKPTSVCFNIMNANFAKKKPPKRFIANSKSNPACTLETLKSKQIQAEKRRKKQREDKLKRIQERQEAARKLAENVDILLQQRALAMGMFSKSNKLKHLPPHQLMATANEVAKSFRDLTKQLNTDLTLRERMDARKSKAPLSSSNEVETKKTKACADKINKKTGHLQKKENISQNVCFTVEVESGIKKNSKKPALSSKQKKVMTREDIEEKQRKAEERQNARMERRVSNVKENREALMKMAMDLERFEALQEKLNAFTTTADQEEERVLLAEQLADTFDRLSKRYKEDLKRAENFLLDQPYLI